MDASTATVPGLVQAARQGDRAAMDSLFAIAYDELRRLARAVRHGWRGQSLATTDLVHEAYLKLISSGSITLTDQAHFKRVIARAIRQVLIDSARRNLTRRRHQEAVSHITLPDDVVMHEAQVLDLDRALQELSAVDPRRAEIVECRFFGGMDVEDTAAALGISTATVKRDWRVARAWLAQALEDA